MPTSSIITIRSIPWLADIKIFLEGIWVIYVHLSFQLGLIIC